MKSLIRIVAYLAAAAFFVAALGVLAVEGGLVFGWDVWSNPVWPALGPYPWAVAHMDGAIYFLPVLAFLVARVGFWFLERARELS